MGFLGALIGAGTSLLGGFLGSSAAEKAGQQQAAGYANAGNFAQNQQNQALGDINSNLAKQQGILSPYVNAGNQAVANLSALTSTPGQGLLQGWNQSFQAPTAEQAANTPGYQFALAQGNKGLQASAAARGGLLSGGTAKALDQYNQGMADQNYQQVYNNQFQNYLQNYNQFQQNQANQYQRLMGQANLGQWGAGTSVNALGQATGQQVGTLENTSQQVLPTIEGTAASQAAGTVGAANAWESALGGIGNAASGYSAQSAASLNSLNNQPTQSGYSIGGPGAPQWQPSYIPQTGPALPIGVPPGGVG